MPPTRNRPEPAPRRPELLALGLLLAAVFFAYANALSLGLALDGNQLVLSDERIRAFTASNLKLIFTTDYWWPLAADRLYRPFTTLSFLVNYSILGQGPQPFGYHAVNVLLHAINACLVFVLGRRLFRAVWPAFFAAALWAVHPVTVDSVTNLAGRADLLAAAGILGALLAYARGSLPGVFFCSALAVFSKESGAVVIAILFLWDLAPGLADKPRRRVPLYLAAALPVAIYLLLRLRVMAALPVPYEPWLDNPLRAAGPFTARWTALKVLALDFGLLLFPANLAADRSFNEIPLSGAADPLAWIGLLVATAIIVIAVLRRRDQPLWFWAAGFFGLTLLPSSNLAVIIGAPMAERFLYMPSIAFAVAAVAILYRYAQPRSAAAVLIAGIVLCAGRTIARNPDWDNNVALTSHDSRTAPGSARLHAMYGDFKYEQNRSDVETPLRELETASRIIEPLPDAQSDPMITARYGFFCLVKGDQAGARTPAGQSWYAKATEALVRAARIARVVQTEIDAAQARAGKPLQPPRPYERVFFTLGDAYRALGENAAALDAYRNGRALAPMADDGYDRAANAALAMQDRGAAARLVLEKALAQGATPKSLAAVKFLYSEVSGGDCAVATQSGITVLNVACPRLREDVCPALADLSSTFTEARQPARAAAFQNMAATQFACAGNR